MKGTIRRRGNAWTLQVYAGRRADGTKRYATRTVRGTRSEADTALAQLVAEVTTGQALDPGQRVTYAELADRWYATRSPDWSPAHAATNRLVLDRHVTPALGPLHLDRITANDIDRLYATLRTTLAASTVRRVHNAIVHPSLERAVRWRLIATNPATGADLPTLDDREVVVPSTEAVRAILAVGDDLSTLWRVAATTGARRGTLGALRWGTVDLDAGTARFERAITLGPTGPVEKANKGRRAFTASLGPDVVAALAAHRKAKVAAALAVGVPLGPGSYVWSPSPASDRPWVPSSTTHAFGRVRARAGHPEVRLHDLKHWAVTQMLTAGIPPHVVAQRTGTTLATIMRVYAHYLPGADGGAAEVMDRVLA